MTLKLNSSVQPILLQGHERSITRVKFNEDGDLLFTASKDHHPTVWNASTGERIGTYDGHKGAVWDLDPSWDSSFLLTAAGDGKAILWNTLTGERLKDFPHTGSVRSVRWAEGGKMFVTAEDAFSSKDAPKINVYHFDPAHIEEVDNLPALSIAMPSAAKATCVDWTLANEHIMVSTDDGHIILFDPQTGEEVRRAKPHQARINTFSFNKEKSLVITASIDHSAKLLNADTLEVMRVYQTERPVNAAVISPLKYHVLLGGGQDAMSVTVTGGSQGKFETRFYHIVYEEEFGRVKGHFGPINALAIHPAGLSYASGSEDGFIRLHHFDNNYLQMNDQIPENLDDEAEADDEAVVEESKEGDNA